MSATIYDDMNPDWADGRAEQPSWEPWESDEPDFDEFYSSGCTYCDCPDVREYPEPFSGHPCCDGCFNVLIGGDRDDPPWRCGNAP